MVTTEAHQSATVMPSTPPVMHPFTSGQTAAKALAMREKKKKKPTRGMNSASAGRRRWGCKRRQRQVHRAHGPNWCGAAGSSTRLHRTGPDSWRPSHPTLTLGAAAPQHKFCWIDWARGCFKVRARTISRYTRAAAIWPFLFGKKSTFLLEVRFSSFNFKFR